MGCCSKETLFLLSLRAAPLPDTEVAALFMTRNIEKLAQEITNTVKGSSNYTLQSVSPNSVNKLRFLRKRSV